MKSRIITLFVLTILINISIVQASTTPTITNFQVKPNYQISTLKPAVMSADITDDNLDYVSFQVVDHNKLIVSKRMILFNYENYSRSNGRYKSIPWNGNIWKITNKTDFSTYITAYYIDKCPQYIMCKDNVSAIIDFKKNSSTKNTTALLWFNQETGKIYRVTTLSLKNLKIENGQSTFRIVQYFYGIDNIYKKFSKRYTLYNIGNNKNPYFVSNAVPMGRYKAYVYVKDTENNYKYLMKNITTLETKVKIKDRKILVNGKRFNVKGVGYSPIPIGDDPDRPPYGDYYTYNYNKIYNRDIINFKKINANTIRLWGWNNTADHKDFLDNIYNRQNATYVIASFWMGPSKYPDISSLDARRKIKEDFREMIKVHKRNPAILMWAIGNELNAPWMYGNRADLFSLINEMALEAHNEEGKNYRPTTTVLVDIDAVNTIKTYNSSMTYLDIWSVDPPVDYNTNNTNNFDILMYRGRSFGTFFNDYKNVSNKPLLILEFGIDAYDDKNKTEYEFIGTHYQAVYAKALWRDISKNFNITSGGTIMAYSDEWWKGKYGQVRVGCPDYNPSYQSNCGYATGSHPDGYSNEEWWGIVRIKDNGNEPDIVQPRKVYYALKRMWNR